MSATRLILLRRMTAAVAAALCIALGTTACGGGSGRGASSSSSSNDSAPPVSTQPPATPLPSGELPSTPSTPPDPSAPSDPLEPPTEDPSGAPPFQPPPPVGTDQASVRNFKLDAIRFLEQSSFGPTQEELARVMEVGIASYLEEQLQRRKTGYAGFTREAYVQANDCKTEANDPNSAPSICARTHYTLFELQRQFFANAMNGEDQLRQRVAFTWSQHFVVSGTEIKHAAGMASYQNMLLDQSFGNFRELLEAVTLHPVMGSYLDMVNNPKGNPITGAKPNENFARELLQLFTLGTERLKLDGTPMVDANGDSLPAYTQADVEALARASSGWTYSAWNPANSRWVNPPKLVGDMVPIESQHDRGAKEFLGVSLPANQSARTDLEQALDRIFEHPNVGPFIATRLIQHLVTSNPTPAYVARVAQIFNDNRRGVRGDLQAVVRAILLDSEARGANKSDSSYGKLKEPALFMTGFLRAFGGTSDGVYLRARSAALGQDIFTAPSVFNFYSPLQRIGAGTLRGPEFGIFDAASALARIDFVYELVYADGAAPDSTVPNSFGTSIAFDAQSAPSIKGSAGDLEQTLMIGKLSTASAQALDTALAKLPSEDAVARARAAAYALGVSAQYQIQR